MTEEIAQVVPVLADRAFRPPIFLQIQHEIGQQLLISGVDLFPNYRIEEFVIDHSIVPFIYAASRFEGSRRWMS